MAEKRVGVMLAGCGYLDGAEIHEATCTLLSIDRRKAKLVAMAPDVPQMHVVDHLKGAPAEGEKRGVLTESARIVRGQITDLATVTAKDLDALTFAGDGRNMKVNGEVERLAREVRAAGKPMGFVCIAPVIAGKLFGSDKVKVTIGNDRDTAAAIESW